MGFEFVQTDTATIPEGAIPACSGATVSALPDTTLIGRIGGDTAPVPGSGRVGVTIQAGVTRACVFMACSVGDVGETNWAAGDWTVPLNIIEAPEADGLTLEEVHVCRVRTGILPISNNIAAATGLGLELALGVTSVTVNAPTFSTAKANDIVYLVFVFTNTASVGLSFDYRPDQVIGTPIITSKMSGTAAGTSTAQALGLTRLIEPVPLGDNIAGVSSGKATVSGDIEALGFMSGTAAGGSTASADAEGTGELGGTGKGNSSSQADLCGTGQMAGTASGSSTAEAVHGNLDTISGTAAGSSTAQADITGTAERSAAAAGGSTASADIAGRADIAGSAAGKASTSAEPTGTAEASGTAAGAATAAAEIQGDVDGAGTAAGAASVQGDLCGTGIMSGTAAGSSSASGAIDDAQMDTISGTAAGSSTASGDLCGTGVMSGTASGSSSATAGAVNAGVECFQLIEALLTAKFVSGVAIPQGLSVRFDNLPFTKTEALWVGLSIRHDPTTIFAVGNKRDSEKRGTLVAQIHLPSSTGVQAGYTLAATIIELFEGSVSMGLYYDAPFTRHFGAIDDTERHIVEVVVPFRFYDEQVAASNLDTVMADIEDFIQTVRTRFRTLVATPQSLPTKYDNLPFTKPASLSAIYCHWKIRPGQTTQIEKGNPKTFRTPGVAVATLFGPPGAGEEAMLELVDAIDAAFRSVSEGVVDFKSPTPSQGRLEDGRWVIDVFCPWEADRTIAA